MSTLSDAYHDSDPQKPSSLASKRLKLLGADRALLDGALSSARAEADALDEQLAAGDLHRHQRGPLEHQREVLRLVTEGIEGRLAELPKEAASEKRAPAAEPDEKPAIAVPPKPTRRRG